MKTVQRPFWLLLSLTVPQAVLFLLFWRFHRIIGTLLSPESVAAWRIFGLTLGAFWLGFTGYALWVTARRRPVHPFAGLTILGLYLPWLYLAALNFGRIIPPDIPRWMFFGPAPATLLYVFALPAFAYALFLLVAAFTPAPEQYKPLRDAILAVAIPAGWYLAINFGLAWLHFGTAFAAIFEHLLPILLILSTTVFLFTTIRLVYGLLRGCSGRRKWSPDQADEEPGPVGGESGGKGKRSGWLKWVINLLLLVLPLVGLALNHRMDDIFGDFTHPLYFALAALTGLLLLLPVPRDPRPRLALFLAKVVVFPFTVYFFLVFLPFLPLAIPAILLAGGGVLMLVPLFLGIRHVFSLRDDLRALRPALGLPLLWFLFISGLALLPGSLYLAARNDGVQIQRALSYLYRTEYTPDSDIRISPPGLARALGNMTANIRPRRFLQLGDQTPILTPLYRWIVLDNLTLAQERIAALRRIFLDEEAAAPAAGFAFTETASPVAPAVVVRNVRTATVREPTNGILRSRIDLELWNETGMDRAEFAAAFDLPVGCYIRNYYLVVDGRKKDGLLADKRAAAWIYRQIVRVRRDPGILIYGSDNRVTLRVFPFAAGETRLTGLELVHAGPVTLVLGGRELRLGGTNGGSAAAVRAGGAIYIPAAVKRGLPRCRRNPAYHFILDFSAAARGRTSSYLARVEDFIQSRGLQRTQVTVTAANYGLKTVTPQGDWRRTLAGIRPEGGFYLDRAVKAFLYRHYRTASPQYPVIVAVTDEPGHWQIYEDYASWRPAFPESDAYYRLDTDGALHGLSFLPGDGQDGGGQTAGLPSVEVLAWPVGQRTRAYLPDDGRDSLVLTDEAFSPAAPEAGGSDWEAGLALEAKSLGLLLNPADYHPREMGITRRSLASKIMTRSTSYLVLENPAQEAALREKQRQILATGKVVDAEETEAVTNPAMAEPPLLLVLVLGGLVLLGRRILAAKKRVHPEVQS